MEINQNVSNIDNFNIDLSFSKFYENSIYNKFYTNINTNNLNVHKKEGEIKDESINDSMNFEITEENRREAEFFNNEIIFLNSLNLTDEEHYEKFYDY